MNIIVKGDGRLFDKTIYLGNEALGKINLALEKGDVMLYDRTPAEKIDFPGEYDIEGITIICLEADGKLSYVIKTDTEIVALLQNAAVLEVSNFENIETWICTDASIRDEIEHLELDGDIVVLGEEITEKTATSVETN